MDRISRIAVLAALAVALAGCARFPLGPMIDHRTDPGARRMGDAPMGPRP